MQNNQIQTTDSILNSIKKYLGVDPEYTEFDDSIILAINTVLAALVQMGIGPQETGYAITGAANVWSEFIETNKKLNMIITYVCMRVKLIFDPPQNSTLINSMNEQIREFEWRAYTEKGNY